MPDVLGYLELCSSTQLSPLMTSLAGRCCQCCFFHRSRPPPSSRFPVCEQAGKAGVRSPNLGYFGTQFLGNGKGPRARPPGDTKTNQIRLLTATDLEFTLLHYEYYYTRAHNVYIYVYHIRALRILPSSYCLCLFPRGFHYKNVSHQLSNQAAMYCTLT